MVLPYINISPDSVDCSRSELPVNHEYLTGNDAKYTPRDNSLFIQCRVCGGSGVNPVHVLESQPCIDCKGTGAKKIR